MWIWQQVLHQAANRSLQVEMSNRSDTDENTLFFIFGAGGGFKPPASGWRARTTCRTGSQQSAGSDTKVCSGFMCQLLRLMPCYNKIRKPFPEVDGVPEASEMVKILNRGHEQVVKTCREALGPAQEAGDESSAALISDRMRIHEKTAWMLRAMH